MDGGTISECTSQAGSGGVHIAAGSVFTMDNGSLYKCTAPCYGGVGVWGTFNLNGGTIDGCSVNGGQYPQGGGICIGSDGAFTMTGGTVKNNYSYSNGGGAYFYKAASIAISGGEFYGNSARWSTLGYGIYQNGSANVSCTGGRFDVNGTYYYILPTDAYTITLNQNGGSNGTGSVTQAWNTDLQAITVPTRNGYTFLGYYNAETGGDQYYDAAGNGVRKWDYIGNQTLYAQWTANTYTIAYNANGGEGTIDSTEATYDANVTLATAPIRTGYTFAGWNTASDGSGTAYAAGASVSNLTATSGETVTLYAQWTGNYRIEKVTVPPDGVTMFDSVQSVKKDANIADMRFFWTIHFNGADRPTMLGAYFFDWKAFEDNTTDREPSVQRTDTEELTDDSIFYGTITNITDFDKEYFALPIVNNKLFHVLLQGTVNGTDINK